MRELSFKKSGDAHELGSPFSDLLLWLLIFVGAAIRLDFLIASDWVIDADEAIVGLMGKHILAGEPLPIFYYGQHYMGSFEAILAALSFALFGISSMALKLVPLIFSIALIPVIYSIAQNLSGRNAARIAAFLSAVPPSALVLWSGMARGGFIEIVFIGAVALLLTIMWLRDEEPNLLRLILIWILLGFGWWINNQIIFFILPIGFALLARCLELRKRRGFFSAFSYVPWAIAAFIFGGSPFWIYNIENSFASFGMLGRATLPDAIEHLSGVFNQALPIILGAMRFWQEESVFPGSVGLTYLFWGGIFLYYLSLRLPALCALCLLKLERKRPIELLAILFVSCIVVFSFSSFGFLVAAPRYLLPIYVALFPLAGIALTWLRERYPLIARTLLIGIVLVNFSSSYYQGRAVAGQPFVYKGERVSKDHSELINWLLANNIKSVETNYWIGYRLAFETLEKVTFSIFREPHQVRIPEYEAISRQVSEKEKPYLLTPQQALLVEAALKELHYSYTRNELSGYIVLSDIEHRPHEGKKIDPAFYSVSASHSGEPANNAVDDNLATRWGTGTHQVPGMTFTATLNSPQIIDGLSWNLGAWQSDYPRKLKIEALLEDGRTIELLPPDRQGALTYWLDRSSDFIDSFDPIKAKAVTLTQLGADPVFDWSMAEFRLYGSGPDVGVTPQGK